MTPFIEACHQLKLDAESRDHAWLEFKEWARDADTPTLLDHTSRLMRGQFDPFYGQIDRRFLNVVERYGFRGVLEMLTDLQAEREEVDGYR